MKTLTIALALMSLFAGSCTAADTNIVVEPVENGQTAGLENNDENKTEDYDIFDFSLTNEDMKKMVIEKVEQTAPEQAKMVKDNIDTLMESGMLKVEGSETATYEFGADGWVKTMTLKNDMTLMGASTNVETTVTLK